MRVTRLHLAAELEPGTRVALPAHAAAHAVRVLRLRPGDTVVLFNGDGHDYPGRLVDATPHAASVDIESRITNLRESPLHITLAQALARGEKMDWIVQKAVELGVAAIVPVVSERSEVKLDSQRAEKRLQHWRSIVVAACEQSGRACVPSIAPPRPLEAWSNSLAKNDGATRLVLHPGNGMRARSLQAVAVPSVILAVGPEGGFSESDLGLLRAADFRELALGPRILRTETAGLAAITALQAFHGDI